MYDDYDTEEDEYLVGEECVCSMDVRDGACLTERFVSEGVLGTFTRDAIFGILEASDKGEGDAVARRYRVLASDPMHLREIVDAATATSMRDLRQLCCDTYDVHQEVYVDPSRDFARTGDVHVSLWVRRARPNVRSRVASPVHFFANL